MIENVVDVYIDKNVKVVYQDGDNIIVKFGVFINHDINFIKILDSRTSNEVVINKKVVSKIEEISWVDGKR